MKVIKFIILSFSLFLDLSLSARLGTTNLLSLRQMFENGDYASLANACNPYLTQGTLEGQAVEDNRMQFCKYFVGPVFALEQIQGFGENESLTDRYNNAKNMFISLSERSNRWAYYQSYYYLANTLGQLPVADTNASLSNQLIFACKARKGIRDFNKNNTLDILQNLISNPTISECLTNNSITNTTKYNICNISTQGTITKCLLNKDKSSKKTLSTSDEALIGTAIVFLLGIGSLFGMRYFIKLQLESGMTIDLSDAALVDPIARNRYKNMKLLIQQSIESAYNKIQKGNYNDILRANHIEYKLVNLLKELEYNPQTKTIKMPEGVGRTSAPANMNELSEETQVKILADIDAYNIITQHIETVNQPQNGLLTGFDDTSADYSFSGATEDFASNLNQWIQDNPNLQKLNSLKINLYSPSSPNNAGSATLAKDANGSWYVESTSNALDSSTDAYTIAVDSPEFNNPDFTWDTSDILPEGSYL